MASTQAKTQMKNEEDISEGESYETVLNYYYFIC
jgi:hypothetical protein